MRDQVHRVARPRADDCGEYEAGRDADAGKLVRYREQAGAEDRLEGVDQGRREGTGEKLGLQLVGSTQQRLPRHPWKHALVGVRPTTT